MQGVGPGTVLGGRYVLRRRLSQGRDFERWSGHDATLDRDVALTIVGAEHPNRAGVLDAARRAAGVEDTRLVRILDVGTQSDNSFIVEEAMTGSDSLATILLQGPLPAEEARRVAGETAKALETAGQRGLHHLRLTPHDVMIAPEGEIRVSGVAIAAAIDGPEQREPDSESALRRDAVCLAAIVYAALTGRWPLEEKVDGVEPAPRMVNGVASAAEIAAGVPGDLDALCRTMLKDDAGPLTPGVFANRIAPWSRQPVHRGEFEPVVVTRVPGPGDTQIIDSTTATGDTAAAATPATATTPATPATATPAAAAAPATPPGKAMPGKAMPGKAPPSPIWAQAAAAVSAAQAPAPVASGTRVDPAPDTGGVGPAARPTVSDKAGAAGAATTKALGSALSSAGAAAGMVGDRLSSFARTAADKTSRPSPDHQTQRMRLPAGLMNEVMDEGPPAPMLPASTALPPGRGQSKIVVLVVAAFLGLSLLVATCGLRPPGESLTASKPSPRRTVIVTAPPVTVLASPSPEAAPTAAEPIAILSATGFDPEGDQSEKNSQAAKVYDGDLSTTWTSEGYGTADFGGLKKGVGVLLDLGQPTSVRQVTIDLGSGPVDLTVYSATSPSLDGAAVIGSANAASGRVTIKPTAAKPRGQYVIVWFTSLVPDGNQFRASISEIALN